MSQESPTISQDAGGLRALLRGLPSLAGDLPGFDPGRAPAEPVALFGRWLTEAIEAGVAEPHAMTLSTVDPRGLPSARVLILKDVDATGWWFASTSAGRKGKELANTPWAALTGYWAALGRQVRVRGPVHPAGAEVSARDYLGRSAGARAVALLARQSEPLADLAELAAELEWAEDRITREPELVAPDWTLYVVAAEEVEFWQGDPRRRHTRLRYTRTGSTWTKELLWP
ncbi:pyridoxine/pyridoxamine 5'-phosphate oxidase [Amycolatopsis aidingensis]|uniref:pyridoxine/pyridoxamine 5'-phosphate oxidase n=1 Tax=Amycolatopsis aidingensis TaxID=2842453 RepID=UPI001C0C53FD|nr:pyridoxal 5'-phosphate synthase [Amycolatopsis aidingensis]